MRFEPRVKPAGLFIIDKNNDLQSGKLGGGYTRTSIFYLLLLEIFLFVVDKNVDNNLELIIIARKEYTRLIHKSQSLSRTK